ncbi:type II secretion system F family protein [Providencia burhodogranariea]|uniref:General secretion pathway protein F n=1 Tax=Providencia burhodogranariea DSM 19968 TaxID=1141662 RepID=K8X8P3_9GAMM|nr:type II secretion system F family protein [Providencia burhodogranariea]EKT64790.1 type IV pilin biogenesis transmembrane protein [Providencia burhodogranariea DSM 19968]
MFIYSYTALTNDSVIIKDIIVSKNKKMAFFDVLELNQTPIKITLIAIFILDANNLNYRIHFFHQLSTLVSSGINLLQSLTILNKNCRLPFWKKIITLAIQDIKKGNSLSDSLKKYPIIFSHSIINLIKVSEKTGKYNENFYIIADMLEYNLKIKQKINQSLRYPVTLISFSFILTFIMLVYVLPEFKTIYQSFKHDLPIVTKILINISDFIIEYLAHLLLSIVTLVLLIYKLIGQHINLLIDLTLKVPLLKKLIKFKNINIYFLTLSSTLQAGLPLLECLKCTTEAIHNLKFKKESLEVYQSVVKGESLSNAVQHKYLFPSIVPQLLAIAEESGQLAHFVQYLFNYLSTQYTTLIEKSLKNLEPILLLLMACLVGILMLAMYLPIFNLGSVITGV